MCLFQISIDNFTSSLSWFDSTEDPCFDVNSTGLNSYFTDRASQRFLLIAVQTYIIMLGSFERLFQIVLNFTPQKEAKSLIDIKSPAVVSLQCFDLLSGNPSWSSRAVIRLNISAVFRN